MHLESGRVEIEFGVHEIGFGVFKIIRGKTVFLVIQTHSMLTRHIWIVLGLLLSAHFPVYGSDKNDSLLQVIEKADNIEKIGIYHELYDIALTEEDFAKAQNFAESALQIAIKLNNSEEQYNALMDIQRVSFEMGNMRTSIQYGQKALKIAQDLDSTLLIARTNNQLGTNYSNIGIFDKSLSHYLVSLKLIEDTLPGISFELNLKYKSLVLNNIGAVYSKMGNKDKALGYYIQALAIRKSQNETYGIASTLQNIGVVYENKKEFDKALELYNEALGIRKTLSSHNDIAELLMNIGIVQIKTNQLDTASYNLKKAITIFSSTGNKRRYSIASLNLAELYNKKGQPDSAYPFMKTSLEISKELNYRINEEKAHQLLSDYYSAKGDYKNAWKNLTALIGVKDTVYNAELAEKISEMQTKYDTEKKEKEIEILARNKEIQSLKIKKQSVQLYLLIAFIFLAGLILILVFSKIKLKQKQIRTELEKKNLKTEQGLLRSQMNPHFIFNSMNSIQSFISGNDSFTAMTYLSKFAQLMRNILENSRKPFIVLSDEISSLELYIQLERTRFKQKFDYKITIKPGLSIEFVYIPPMLIQPFVENAIKHGLVNKAGKGLLEIEFMQTDKLITCIVRDNGVGREKAKEKKQRIGKSHHSLGMQLSRERLEALGKERKTAFNFHLTDLIDKNDKAEGTEVSIQLPFEWDS